MLRYHVHALNWNEHRLLPVFFRHYASAQRIFIHDNESDPEVQRMIRAAGAELVPFSTGGRFDNVVQQSIKNHVWKASRSEADFVIVQDLDELLHFPWAPGDIVGALEVLRDMGVTFARSKCVSVVCSDEEWDAVLESPEAPWSCFHRGAWGNLGGPLFEFFDKVQVFAPSRVTETNYTPGAHHWHPEGDLVAAPPGLEPLLLHCKHIGPRYEAARRLAMKARLAEADRRLGHNLQYQADEATIVASVESCYRDPQVKGITSHLDRAEMHLCSADPTAHVTETLARFLSPAEARAMRVLEIGCHEGLATKLLAEHFCRLPGSRIDCVDAFADDPLPGANRNATQTSRFERFVFNTRGQRERLRLLRVDPSRVVPLLCDEYDLVCVHGDRGPEQVARDVRAALRVVRRGGHVMIGYLHWTHDGIRPREEVTALLKEFDACLQVVQLGAQLLLRIREQWNDPLLARTRQVHGLPAMLLETWGARDAIAARLLQGMAWEPHVALVIARFFHANANAAFIDLGANIGIHTITALLAGARHAYVFECHPESLRKLSRNLALNDCGAAATVVPLAASSITGRSVELRHVESNVGASFLAGANNRFAAASTRSIGCRTVRVDDVSFDVSLDSFDALFVKLDIEGGELAALQGMERLLASSRAIRLLVELNPLATDRVRLGELLDYLEAKGWKDARVIFSVPPDTWHGPALPLDSPLAFAPATRQEIDDLLARDAVVEMLFSR